MQMAIGRIDAKGCLALPREVLAALDVSPGDELYFVIHGDYVLLTAEPENYAPYLRPAGLDAGSQTMQFPDRPSLPEDWLGWEEWEGGEDREWKEEKQT